jgi:heme/copper-type cytochrome/quinol oxidase subunit 4
MLTPFLSKHHHHQGLAPLRSLPVPLVLIENFFTNLLVAQQWSSAKRSFIYMYICMYVFIYIHTHMYIYIYLWHNNGHPLKGISFICAYIYIYIFMYIYIYICISICLYV